MLLDARFHDLLAIIKGFRNGAVYGVKVRLPHSFVMTFLFRNGTLKDKLRLIFKATFTHSRNLALFVTCYKTCLVFLKNVFGESRLDPFYAGLVSGYIVFHEDNAVSQQVIQIN